jgi:hypothetical protein
MEEGGHDIHVDLQVSLIAMVIAMLPIWSDIRNGFCYSYGTSKIASNLCGPYPDPMRIALRQKPSTVNGLDMAKVHPGVDWKEKFGVFVYAMPQKK